MQKPVWIKTCELQAREDCSLWSGNLQPLSDLFRILVPLNGTFYRQTNGLLKRFLSCSLGSLWAQAAWAGGWLHSRAPPLQGGRAVSLSSSLSSIPKHSFTFPAFKKQHWYIWLWETSTWKANVHLHLSLWVKVSKMHFHLIAHGFIFSLFFCFPFVFFSSLSNFERKILPK